MLTHISDVGSPCGTTNPLEEYVDDAAGNQAYVAIMQATLVRITRSRRIPGLTNWMGAAGGESSGMILLLDGSLYLTDSRSVCCTFD